MIHGEDLIVAIGGTPLAASKSCNVNKAQSFIEVSSPISGAWESFIPTKRGWKISSDCLLATMDAYKTLDAAWKAGTALDIRFYDTDYNENEVGTAYIESLELTASKGNLAKMSVSLRGSGALSNGSRYIPFNRTLYQNGKYYWESVLRRIYILKVGENGKVYGGSINLAKRTLVRFATRGCDIFYSTSNSIITKAQRGDDISIITSGVSYLNTDSDIWLDAGTWYIVVSNQNYSNDPTLTAINEIN